jgi:regulator of RNase E activity RraA
MIVDGAGRDIDELEDIGWPIWTRGDHRARHAHHVLRAEGGALDQCASGLRRRRCPPRDFVVADTIGVAVVPLDKAEEVIELARAQADREQTTREWVAKERRSRTCSRNSAGFEADCGRFCAPSRSYMGRPALFKADLR